MKQPIVINVDDHEVSRMPEAALLKAAGFTVYEVATGKEAVRSGAVQHPPDIVLLDVHHRRYARFRSWPGV